jgi:hypothetical protein
LKLSGNEFRMNQLVSSTHLAGLFLRAAGKVGIDERSPAHEVRLDIERAEVR